MATVKAIKYGMKGDYVANLQSILNKLGYKLDIDGSFGPKTLAAVKDYQAKNGLTVDGMVGPQTQALLFGGSSSQLAADSGSGSIKPNMQPDVDELPASNPTVSVPTTNVNTPSTGNAANTSASRPVTGGPSTPDPGDIGTSKPDTGSMKPDVDVLPSSNPTVESAAMATAGNGGGNKGTGFSYAPYQSSGAVNSAVGNGFTYDGFTYDPYQSSGAVEKATGNGFSYDSFSYDPYQSSGAVDKAIGNGFTYDSFSNPTYVESETVQKANAALESVLAAQPGAYQSKWQSQVEGIIDQILNRGAFNYDFNEDALYKQYAEQYMRRGKLAMQDTMGQAAAMTGGYGSSYASTAGNQAYQEYLSQLNEVIPELYGMALERYQMEGQDMYNKYGMLSAQEQQEYGRYLDIYNQWLAERDYASGRYDSERNFDYSKYTDDRNFNYGVYSDDKQYAYNDYRNAIEDAKWKEQQEYAQYSDNRNFDYGVYESDKSYAYSDYRNAIEDAKWTEENEYNKYVNDRNFAYGVHADDKQYAYNDYLTKIDNAKWTEEQEYKQYLDNLGIAYDEHMNALDLEQLAKDNAYREKVYNDSLTQQEKDNAYREKVYQDGVNSEAKAYAREDVLAVISAGGTPSDEQLKAAGMSKDTAAAYAAISSGNGDSEEVIDLVGKMSTADIMEMLETYASDGDDNAIDIIVDDLYLTGRITEEQWNDMKKKYKSGNAHTITDTTVAVKPNSSGGGGGTVLQRAW